MNRPRPVLVAQALVSRLFLLALAIPPLQSGPVEFGLDQLRKAIQSARLPPARTPRIAAEVWPGTKADAFEITPYRVSGGDIRGLMYGLLEASDQINKTGKLTPQKTEPAVQIRGVRIILRNADWELGSLHSRSFWNDYFARLARARFNRFQLVLGQEAWQAPQLPYFFSLPFFERVAVDGLTPLDRGRNLDALKMIAQTASEYALDLTLGVRFGATGARIRNLADEFRGPYIRTALPHLLEEVPWVRAVAVHDCPEEILREAVIPALESAGRLVTLELPGQPALLAREVGAAIRILQPLLPGTAVPDLAKLRSREIAVIRVVPPSRWTDPRYVRRVSAGIELGSANGFEVEGTMDLDSVESRLLYASWGRLGYQRKATIEEEQGEQAEAMACAARIQDAALPLDQLQECSVRLERSENKDLTPLGQQASLRVRLLWAKAMEDYYARTKHESALRAAYYSYRAAARTAPRFQTEAERLQKLIDQLDPEQPFTAMPWTVPGPRPALVHAPVAAALTGIPLQIAASAPASAGVTTLRLHYRHLSGPEGFQTLETTPRLGRFTIPAAQLATPGQLVYWLEFVHASGVWRLPEEQSISPVFLTVLKAPPPIVEAEEAKPATAVAPKKQK